MKKNNELTIVADKEKGIKMIIFLQSLAGIAESEEVAGNGWDKMSEGERENTVAAYEMLGGPSVD